MSINKKAVDNILKMKSFHNLKCNPYPHEKLNTSKSVIRNRELSLATPEEVNAGKRSPTILGVNKPSIPKELKTGLMTERVKQYLSNPLRYFKCQKYGHHKES